MTTLEIVKLVIEAVSFLILLITGLIIIVSKFKEAKKDGKLSPDEIKDIKNQCAIFEDFIFNKFPGIKPKTIMKELKVMAKDKNYKTETPNSDKQVDSEPKC